TVLLETGHDGTVVKLEVATSAGLLTLHPEGSTLHGNVARPTGIEHVTLPWDERRLLLIVGTPATAAAAARLLEADLGVGDGQTRTGVSIDVGLTVTPATFRVARLAARRWRF